MVDDTCNVCNFANRDEHLPSIAKDFNDACHQFVAQAGDLGRFQCWSAVLIRKLVPQTSQ